MKLTLTPKFLTASVTLAAIALVLAYALNGHYLMAALLLVMGVLWLLDFERRWNNLASVVLIVFALFCILGYWLQLSMPLLVLALAAALGGWDLDHFSRRMERDLPVMNINRLERHHLQQLGTVLGAGLVIGEAVLLIQLTLNFWAIFWAAVLALFGLMRVLVMIRSSG
jgi:hypothetical protein